MIRLQQDIDLARKILLLLTDEKYDGNNRFYTLPTIEDYSPKQIEYDVNLLMEKGFLKARRPFDGSPFIPYKLTGDGHDFIKAAKDESRWKKAKEIVKEKGGELGLDVLKAVLIQLFREAMGMR